MLVGTRVSRVRGPLQAHALDKGAGAASMFQAAHIKSREQPWNCLGPYSVLRIGLAAPPLRLAAALMFL